MSFIEGQDIARAMALSEHDYRRIGEADPEIGEALDDPVRAGDVLRAHRLEHVCAPLDLLKQARASGEADGPPNGRLA